MVYPHPRVSHLPMDALTCSYFHLAFCFDFNLFKLDFGKFYYNINFSLISLSMSLCKISLD